jgi:hypothetical protein
MISMWFNQSGLPNGSGPGNLHLVFLESGVAWEYLQTPNNQWGKVNGLPTTGTVLQAVKLVQCYEGGSSPILMAIVLDNTGIDNTGQLWFATSNDSGNWSAFGKLPNGSSYMFKSFDAVFIPFIGVVLAATTANGTTYTQTTSDNMNWSQPGWNNRPSAFGTGSWPPQLFEVVIGDNGRVHEGDNAPLLAGLFSGAPHVLYNDSSNENWQWSQIPAVPAPDFPIAFNVSFCEGQGPYSPLLFFVGYGQQIYCAMPSGGPSSWSYYPVALPNANPAVELTKAKAVVGYVNNSNGFGNIQVIAIGTDQSAYLIWQNGVQPNPIQGNWVWNGPLPQLPNLSPSEAKAMAIADFDVSMANNTLQVAYLTTNSSVFINFQVEDGGWGVFLLFDSTS